MSRPMPITAENILDSDGKYPERAKHATPQHRANAAITAARVNALLIDLGFTTDRPEINDGYRDASVKYGATKSAHKEGKALDLADKGQSLSPRITRALLRKHGLRREDNAYTASWCHLDTREPHGSIFKP